MTDQEILIKAIEKAIENGWNPYNQDGELRWARSMSIELVLPGRVELGNSTGEVIFNHDFAKALWGENLVKVDELHWGENYATYGKITMENTPIWKAHLQKMVIADNPIQYLREHI